MKRIIAILAALLLALAGCGRTEREPGKQESSTPVQSREEAPSSESQPAVEKTLPVFQPPVLEDPPFGLEDGEGSPEQNEWYQKRYLEPIFQSGILGKTFDAANKTHGTGLRHLLRGPFPRDPYYNAGTRDEENYQAMVKEIVPRLEGGDGLVITEPQG